MELALGGAGRARVQGHDLPASPAAEGRTRGRSGSANAAHSSSSSVEVVEAAAARMPVGRSPGSPARIAQARLADAEDPPLVGLEHVAVVVRQRRPAEVAALRLRGDGRGRPTAVRQAPQPRDGLGARGAGRGGARHRASATSTLRASRREQRHRLERAPTRRPWRARRPAGRTSGRSPGSAGRSPSSAAAAERPEAARAGVAVGEQRARRRWRRPGRHRRRPSVRSVPGSTLARRRRARSHAGTDGSGAAVPPFGDTVTTGSARLVTGRGGARSPRPRARAGRARPRRAPA